MLQQRLEVYNVLETIASMEEENKDGIIEREIEKIPLYVSYSIALTFATAYLLVGLVAGGLQIVGQGFPRRGSESFCYQDSGVQSGN